MSMSGSQALLVVPTCSLCSVPVVIVWRLQLGPESGPRVPHVPGHKVPQNPHPQWAKNLTQRRLVGKLVLWGLTCGNVTYWRVPSTWHPEGKVIEGVQWPIEMLRLWKKNKKHAGNVNGRFYLLQYFIQLRSYNGIILPIVQRGRGMIQLKMNTLRDSLSPYVIPSPPPEPVSLGTL